MKLIFFGILAVLFITACAIGVVALYLSLKDWAWENMNIMLPPKAEPKESYWETLENSVVPTYVCGECGYKSDRKYRCCPWCGKKVRNWRDWRDKED